MIEVVTKVVSVKEGWSDEGRERTHSRLPESDGI
jgi:hypothetical protein